MNLVSFRSEKTLVITMLIKIIILLNLVIASQRKFILQTINRWLTHLLPSKKGCIWFPVKLGQRKMHRIFILFMIVNNVVQTDSMCTLKKANLLLWLMIRHMKIIKKDVQIILRNSVLMFPSWIPQNSAAMFMIGQLNPLH